VTARRTQTRPVSFLHVLGEELAARSRRFGVRTRIAAEEAITWGVPREYIFHRNGSLKINAVRVFSSTYGSMSCLPTKLVSLDMDTVDGPRWGVWTEVDMEVIADLIRASFELDPAAFDREDDRYDPWMHEVERDRYGPEADNDDGYVSEWEHAA
jgi:hypothetical protein